MHYYRAKLRVWVIITFLLYHYGYKKRQLLLLHPAHGNCELDFLKRESCQELIPVESHVMLLLFFVHLGIPVGCWSQLIHS